MFKTLLIEYGHNLTLEYTLRDYTIVQRWAAELCHAQQHYSIDDPFRFYGFGSIEEQINAALDRINKNISVVKSHFTELKKGFVNRVDDQDLLNYWHHQFEVYHGLLDHRPDSVPDNVRSALADLNVCVHRCESIAAGANPRHVVTYYGWPKTQQLASGDYDHFTQIWNPGTLCLNYVEIGKTLEDLARDNDRYIGADAFRPFKHFSADFNVKFYGQTALQAEEKECKIHEYYLAHRDFFGPWRPEYKSGVLPLADIVGTVNLDQLKTRQQVTKVTLI